MKTMLLLFSHHLLEEQIEYAKRVYKVENFISLPNDLQYIWSNVPPELKSVKKLSQNIKRFILENSFDDDIVLIQGDSGLVYHLVNFCKENNLVPIYATTKREIKEYQKDSQNIKETIFEFRRFREYE